MKPILSVDLDDPTPPYEQLRRELALLIETGQLAPDERLPPLRQLAGDLGVAVGTVARTYRELEAAGLIQSRRGGGTRVAAVQSKSTTQARLNEAALNYAQRIRALGASREQAHQALDRALASLETRTRRTN